jgi:hypothetical protein
VIEITVAEHNPV